MGQKGFIILRGNVDSAEIADVPSLDLERATTVQDFLIAQGLPKRTLSIAGDGATNPLVPTGPNTSQGENRYVDVLPEVSVGPVQVSLDNCVRWIRSSCEGEHPNASRQACDRAWSFLSPRTAG